MAQKTIVPVILSGGSGQRLWPVSRELHPKQLINLVTEQSLLQETVMRLQGPQFADPLVVSNDGHRFVVAEQLREIGVRASAVILEPSRRNTAPAAALAALVIQRNDPGQLMLVAPSDHQIRKPKEFLNAVEIAAEAASEGKLVTFGVNPDRPATGYGYIKKGAAVDGIKGCFSLDGFTEKPDAGTAEKYISSGDYYWNSGLFLFSAERYLEILEGLRPDIVSACRKAVEEGRDDLDFFRPEEGAFEACPADSIDYAVMEHTADGAVVPVDMEWNDVGSWVSLWDLGEKDSDGNVEIGDVIAKNVKDSYIRSEGPLVSVIGLENVVVVATGDAVLAVSKDAVDNIKSAVEDMKGDGRNEVLSHPKVYRPWGWYQTLEKGEGYQVKHLMIKPGQGISLQSHEKRAEHWVVVAGTAQVTRDEEVITLGVNESTYIPIGVKHRLENLGSEPLSVIEVQSGSYLGEDDIQRFEDQYGRD